MIFILGAPRSGTTWIGKIFDSHPDVLYRHEPDSIVINTEIPFRLEKNEAGKYLNQAIEYVDTLKNVHSPKSSCSLPVFRKSYRSAGVNAIYPALIYTIKAMHSRLGFIPFMGKLQVPDLIRPDKQEDLVPVIKSVNSLCRAHLFLQCGEDIKIIHIIRHPCGFVASRLRGIRLNLMGGSVFLRDLSRMPLTREHGYTLEKLESLTPEEQLAFQWMISNEKTMKDLEGHPRYRVVVYEEICLDPLKQIMDLFQFSGLDWSLQTKAFLDRCEENPKGDGSYFNVIRSPQKAAFRWKKELESSQIDRIMNLVANSKPGSLFI